VERKVGLSRQNRNASIRTSDWRERKNIEDFQELLENEKESESETMKEQIS